MLKKGFFLLIRYNKGVFDFFLKLFYLRGLVGIIFIKRNYSVLEGKIKKFGIKFYVF